MFHDSSFDISIRDGIIIDILLLYHKIKISFFIISAHFDHFFTNLLSSFG